jgi:microcystin-dependent protein
LKVTQQALCAALGLVHVQSALLPHSVVSVCHLLRYNMLGPLCRCICCLQDQFKLGVQTAPTLLLTAHFDSFSLAPGAPAGADAAASGAAACLLLLRLLQRLYTSAETQPSRNIVVLLTTGGPYGQQGLRQWAADIDPGQLEALQAAIVLDSIGGSVAVQQQGTADSSRRQQPQLHMHHAAATSSSSSSAAWADAVTAAAARMGVQLAAVQQEHAGSEDAAAAVASAFLGHEHLARKGVPAVSLSYMPAALAGQQPRLSSLADTAAAVNLDRVLDAAQVRVVHRVRPVKFKQYSTG